MNNTGDAGMLLSFARLVPFDRKAKNLDCRLGFDIMLSSYFWRCVFTCILVRPFINGFAPFISISLIICFGVGYPRAESDSYALMKCSCKAELHSNLRFFCFKFKQSERITSEHLVLLLDCETWLEVGEVGTHCIASFSKFFLFAFMFLEFEYSCFTFAFGKIGIGFEYDRVGEKFVAKRGC